MIFQSRFLTVFVILSMISHGKTEKSMLTRFFMRYIAGDCGAGIDYFKLNADQLEKDRERDMSTLKLVLYTATERTDFNMDEGTRIVSFRNFNVSLPVVVYIPGYLDVFSVPGVMSTLIARGGINAMGLYNLEQVSKFYLKSVTYTRFIGESLGTALAEMKSQGVIKIHVVGLSIGAHMAGFAGKTYEKLTGEKLDRITGLDPAGPCFFSENPDLKLKATDADFVDIIHTDKNIIGIGKIPNAVNFFPNGGNNMPGCSGMYCDHVRSWIYFVESIRNGKSYPAVSCESYKKFLVGGCADNEFTYMGYDVSREASGDYYLVTPAIYSTAEYVLKSKYLPVSMFRDWILPSN